MGEGPWLRTCAEIECEGLDDRVGEYGHLIVDECHHLSARRFEQVAGRAKAKFVAGLSATVARKDGHHPIIFMQCGPVRYRVNAKEQAALRPFEHTVIVRPTGFHSDRSTLKAHHHLVIGDSHPSSPSRMCLTESARRILSINRASSASRSYAVGSLRARKDRPSGVGRGRETCLRQG